MAFNDLKPMQMICLCFSWQKNLRFFWIPNLFMSVKNALIHGQFKCSSISSAKIVIHFIQFSMIRIAFLL